MKRIPKLELDQLALPALALVVIGFLVMLVPSVQELGAMLFSIGLFPLVLIALRHIK
jgi:uncharacterized RDD family membrane protein YckC